MRPTLFWLAPLIGACLWTCGDLFRIAWAMATADHAVVFSPWLKPYERDAKDLKRLKIAVAETCPSPHGKYIFVGVEYPSFNANSAAFLAADRRRDIGFSCIFTSLGYAESDPEKSMQRINWGAGYFITIRPDLQSAPDAFNRVNLAVLDLVSRDPLFEQIPSVSPDLLIYHRKADTP
jgi:hypothetical protein